MSQNFSVSGSCRLQSGEQRGHHALSSVPGRAADLLVPARRSLGQAGVHDRAHVRLVHAHAEGGRRDHDVVPLARPVLHDPATRLRARLPREQRDAGVAAFDETTVGRNGLLDLGGVHDHRPRQSVDHPVDLPVASLGVVEVRHHHVVLVTGQARIDLEPCAIEPPSAAQDRSRRPAQGRGEQHETDLRRGGPEFREQGGKPLEVGSEAPAPALDGVGLVDEQVGEPGIESVRARLRPGRLSQVPDHTPFERPLGAQQRIRATSAAPAPRRGGRRRRSPSPPTPVGRRRAPCFPQGRSRRPACARDRGRAPLSE